VIFQLHVELQNMARGRCFESWFCWWCEKTLNHHFTLRCVKVVKAKKLNLQGCARVHEKTEGLKSRPKWWRWDHKCSHSSSVVF